MAGDERSITGLPLIGGRRNLRDEVIETLRGAVISGEMRPGVVYSAPTLAERFGVSATPVREAMLDLVKEGLMETMRNKGFRVTEPTEHELDDVTELRALIEVPTVRRIAEAGGDADALKRLRELAAGIERASVDHDLIDHVRFDMEFHLALLGLAGNEHLVEIVRSLRARSRIYGLKVLAERGQLVSSAREHAELVDLIEARDADGAEALMRRHIGHVRGIWAAEP
ncbi:GntR family transcriptional regulator [Amycolatopsis sp. WAC 01375]|uniref:GntR family transcriptional regulator n=1 Tax=unclassified Amycolatopsis TaxID=2618356 RepID=UPI000F790B16|nr:MULTISPECIES: GntR family transcriptional regulator [unclassified Amycolatopsis]RSM74426.1 GntR family transcriptional regulator [Amycolatopsis sp. WAC 01375]RSN21554.1 GntR family transcriptional regulator [Amycolatopsis sp. WAC 01416]